MIGAAGRPAIITGVRDRLSAAPGIYHAPVEGIDIFLLADFLTPDECAALIGRIDESRQPSQVLAPIDDPDYRTSETCNLDPRDPVIRAVETRITALIGIDPRHGETIQGQRYAAGQQFKPHHDFFHTDQPYWAEQERIGGQRTWTAMIFLNQPEAGGHTKFQHVGIEIVPRTGSLLAWNNLDAAGEMNPYSLHQGMPVTVGVKYIITKWYRERPWGFSA